MKRRLSETGLRLTGKSWAYFRRTAEKMTSACSPGVDRLRLKVCWVESAKEKQYVRRNADAKPTRATAILSCHCSSTVLVTLFQVRNEF